MTGKKLPIDAQNIGVVRGHIRREFAEKSWWPAEGPLQAKEEFERAEQNPQDLAEWCANWLSGSQWRELKRAVEKAISCQRDQGESPGGRG